MKKTTYIMFRNDGRNDMVPERERHYFLFDNYGRMVYRIIVDDCGEGSYHWRQWMVQNNFDFRVFGEKRSDHALLEEWWKLHHRSTQHSKRSDELMLDVDRGMARALPETLIAALVNDHTNVVNLMM